MSAAGMVQAAAAVLRGNDRTSHTVAAPTLYPHQWSWDAAFVSIGWATLSVERALTELRSLLRGQWRTGMIPHIVFSPTPGYFPGPERWRTGGLATAPSNVATSGICQPPVHGLAIHIIGRIARESGGRDTARFEEFARATLGNWLAWHRWLDEVRATHPTGLVEIHHGWESGMDNSPRWDLPYSRVGSGTATPYERLDLRHVADPSERPTHTEYDRYVRLVDQLAALRYDDDAARETVEFRVGDTFFTALHALSADLLAQLAGELGRQDEADELSAIAARARTAVARSVGGPTGLARDHDHRTGEWLESATLGAFSPLICGIDDESVHDRLVAELMGPRWCGHPDLARPLPPTTSPDDPAYVPGRYWRGPNWPVVTWLLCWCLERNGQLDAAGAIRAASLEQLSDQVFGEYYDSSDGRALGSRHQSWTAAVALAFATRVPVAR